MYNSLKPYKRRPGNNFVPGPSIGFVEVPHNNNFYRHNNNNVSINNTAYKSYFCPGCSKNFDCLSRNNQFTGRVPLILTCQHTVCQECIYKSAIKNDIVCPTCENKAVLPKHTFIDNLPSVFPPNYYLIGIILWNKPQGGAFNKSFNLVPVGVKNQKMSDSDMETSPGPSSRGQKCCFNGCTKSATMNCPECNDTYCTHCCTIIHKSARQLWSHKPVQITESHFAVELQRCPQHSDNEVEFYCKTCDTMACIYCALAKHEGHKRVSLSELDEEEQNTLQVLKGKAEKVFKQLLASQKKIHKLKNTDSSSDVELEICACFVNLHAQLFTIERKLREKCQNPSQLNKSLQNITTQVNSSIEHIKRLIRYCDVDNSKKLNLRGVLEELREVELTPCYLFCEENINESMTFSVDPLVDHLEQYFDVVKSENTDYKLLNYTELPENYEHDLIDSQIENEAINMISSLSLVNNKKEESRSHRLSTGPSPTSSKTSTKKYRSSTSIDYEQVIVTHIENLEKFFVQLRKNQGYIINLNKEIQNLIKIGAPPVDSPEIGLLYLAQHITQIDQLWCRARLMDIIRSPEQILYEVFLIDYGLTRRVPLHYLRIMSPALEMKRPMAIQCKLHNPSSISYAPNAHVFLGKIINEKETFIIEKGIFVGVHEVDLMISSSDGSVTSAVDLLVNTFPTAFSGSEDSFSMRKDTYIEDLKLFQNSKTFKKNQSEDVVIASITDPYNVFVHIAQLESALFQMNRKLKEYFKNTRSDYGCLPVVGTFVVVEYKNKIMGNWHRALIKKVDLNAEVVDVLLVDWGANVSVPASKVRRMSSQFTVIECQAIKVKLAHIAPFGKSGTWLDSANQLLMKYYNLRDQLKMVVHCENPLEVALFETYGSVDICINAEMVRENFADSTGIISTKVEWPQHGPNYEANEEANSFVADMLKRVNDHLSDDDLEDAEHQKGVKQQVEIVKFMDPDMIFIKFLAKKDEELNLQEELQIHYSKEAKTKQSWQKSEDCVIYSNRHKQFVRGRILEKVDRKYRINFFDKAEEITIAQDRIFEYAPYFKKYPHMTFKCYLADIQPAGDTGKWSKTSVEALEQIFNTHKQIHITKAPANVTKDRSLIPVYMWYTEITVPDALEPSDIKYISINKLLVRLGFAFKPKKESEITQKLTNSLDKSLARDDSLDTTRTTDSDSPTLAYDWNSLVEGEEEKCRKETTDQGSPYKTTVAPVSDWEAPFPVSKQKFDAWVTFADKDGTLFLHDIDLHHLYKDLETHMKTFFDSNPRSESKKWKVGDVCTISYDNFWYRGKVLRIINQDEIDVVMVDFGSEHTVSAEDLHVTVMYPDIPAFATKVQLDSVYPKCGEWLSSDYDTLMNLVTENSRIVVVSKLNVDLPSVNVYNDKGLLINRALVKQCSNLINESPCEIDIEDSTSDIVVIEEEEEEEDFGAGGDQGFYVLQPLPEEAYRSKAMMTIVSILSYNIIVLNKVTKTNLFAKMYKDISEDIQICAAKQPQLVDIEVGKPCVCPYSEDGIFYRARIHEISGLELGYVFVFFVDFGNVESVPLKDLKVMKPEWFRLPVHSYVANLNIELCAENHLEHVVLNIKKLHEKDKMVEIISEDPLTVNLYDFDGKPSLQSLIDSKLIKEKIKLKT